MLDRDKPQGAGQGPLDAPERDVREPVGGNA
jgi:hypothetical protein